MTWTFAKSVPDKPHEYLVEEQARGRDFDAFHALIEEQGTPETFEGNRWRYLRVDEHEYWTSFSWFGGGRMINRRAVAGSARPEQLSLL